MANSEESVVEGKGYGKDSQNTYFIYLISFEII